MGVAELRRLKQLQEENRKLKKIVAWRIDYNEHRPHTALGNQTPQEYASRWKLSRTVKEGVS